MKLANQIINGNRTALAKGITLLESTLFKHKDISQQLISACLPFSGKSIRIGITGVPGVGKSTFIEVFGKLLISKGKKVAVLAIDPTSQQNQGSILGDKSRMNELSKDHNAFIRPSPNSGVLGGVANKSRESIILCEAAGYDVILVETVGVGQSETTVSNLSDFLLLLMLSGAGDELQGIKRGIMELADAVIINKSDGNNILNAKTSSLEYRNALSLFPQMENGWTPKVSVCSSLNNTGIDKIWNLITQYNTQMINNGWKNKKRKTQNLYWLHHIVKEELGNKRYNILLAEKKFKLLEKDLIDGKTIYELLQSL